MCQTLFSMNSSDPSTALVSRYSSLSSPGEEMEGREVRALAQGHPACEQLTGGGILGDMFLPYWQ